MTHNADPPFGSAKLLIERGKEHTDDFMTRAAAFFKTRPCEAVRELDPESGDTLLKMKLVKPLPDKLRPIISDAVNNLRHALDHAANDAAVLLRGGKRDTYFPMGKTAKEYADIYNGRRYKTFPADLRAYIDGLQPYIGGNDTLYALGRISAPNKHQIVVGAGVDTNTLRINSMSSTGGGKLMLAGGNWDRTKNEMLIARLGPGTHVNYDFQVPFTVTILNPATNRFEAVVGLLDKFAGVAEAIVLGIEAETNRLLAAKGQHGHGSPPPSAAGAP